MTTVIRTDCTKELARGSAIDGSTFVELPEDDPIVADAFAVVSLPLRTLQRLHVAPLGLFFLLKFVDSPFDSRLDIARELQKLFFRLAGELNAPAHALWRARASIVHA